jgi:hypothetical protein
VALALLGLAGAPAAWEQPARAAVGGLPPAVFNPVDRPAARLASITSLSPTRGLVGTSVTITGTNLQEASLVRFGNALVEPTARSASSITAIVPAGAGAGSVTVFTPAGTATSNQTFELVQPAVEGFAPNSGPVSTRVIVRGAGLTGATHVRFGSILAPVEGSSYSQVTARVPQGAGSGPVGVIVAGQEPRSTASFSVASPQATPVFSGFTPTSGAIGSTVRISGTNLGAVSEVRFNGKSAPFTPVSSTQINATVPVGATSGPISLRWSGGVLSRTASFTVTGTGPNVARSVVGRVQNAAGVGIGNVTVVRINKANSNDAQQTVSDDGGNFSFSNVAPGVHQFAPFGRGLVFSPPFREATVSGASVALPPFVGVASATTHAVSGRVLRAGSNAPVPGARVMLFGNPNPRFLTFDRLLWVATTDDTGTYRFPSVPVDLYVVRVEKPGYAFAAPDGRNFLPVFVSRPTVAAPFFGASGVNPPANDAFARARALSGPSGAVADTLTGATRELGEPAHGPGVPATSSIWYRWTAPASGRVLFSTESARVHDTVLAAYSGTSLAALTQLASNDDISSPLSGARPQAGNNSSTVQFDAVAGRAYFLAVDGKFAQVSGGVGLKWHMPANDAYRQAQVLAGASGTARGSNALATREAFEAAASGGRSVWYVWVAPTSGTALFTTAGSGFDTVLDAYKYLPSTDTLSLLARNDNASVSDRTSRVSFPAEAGAAYVFAVDGFRAPSSASGASGNITLSWSIAPSRLTLSIAPLSFSEAAVAGTVRGTISRSVSAPTALTVQLSSSAPTQVTAPATATIPAGATGATFVVSPVNDALVDGNRSVTITASAPGTASASLSVTVLDDDATSNRPTNDERSAAQSLNGPSGSVQGTNQGATEGVGDDGEEFYGRSVWYKWTAPASGLVSFTTTNSSFDTTLSVFSHDPWAGNFSVIGGNNDQSPGITASRVTLSTVAGTVYYIAVDGYEGAQGSLTLNWGPASGTR